MRITSQSEKFHGLVLIGMPSCGKSTIGRQVAGRLGKPFIDLDECIVERYRRSGNTTAADGASVRDVYRRLGEQAFRRLEAAALAEVVESRPGAVLAPGGGVPMRVENARLLRLYGLVVYLAIPKKTWLQRAREGKGLPAFLAGPDVSDADLERFFQERHNVYRRTAHATVTADRLRPEQAAEAVIRLLEHRSF